MQSDSVYIPESEKEECYFKIDNGEIPYRFMRAKQPSRSLVVFFHGAVDKSKRTAPVFTPCFEEISLYAHQISISDPTILCKEEITLAWYAGHDSFHTQTHLPKFIEKVKEHLLIEKIIFVGTSGGGFAALFNSWHFEKSFVIVQNPQTKISSYYKRHIETYKRIAWPDLQESSSLSQKICENVVDLYERKIPNTVIYLQNMTDHLHIYNHMTPFLMGIRENINNKKVILESSFPGKIGHGPIWSVVELWLKAVLIGNDTESIIKAKTLISEKEKLEEPRQNKEHQRGFKEADLEKAKLLSRIYINESSI